MLPLPHATRTRVFGVLLALTALVAALLVADVATVAAPSRGAAARADVPSTYPAPSWWDGDCDTDHWTAQARSVGWTGAAAHRLGAVYLGIPVCGPRTLDGAPDVWWKRSGWGELEWECVEYAQRFMVQVYGVNPYQANGVDVVRNYTPARGGGLVTVANGTAGRAPQPGDVVSFASPTNPWGHVAVVASSTVDAGGNGSVKLLSQNDTSDGWRTLAVANWRMAAFGSLSPYGWLHDPLGRGGSGLSDGAFVVHAGAVYRLAGGAPVYVSTWSVFGGVKPYVTVTDAQWNALRTTPRDGTYLRDPVSGRIYRVAGGAAMYLYSCAGSAFRGCADYVEVDPAALASAGGPSPWNHLRATPADGTFLRIGDDSPTFGIIGRAAGGALLRLYDCVPLGGCTGSVDVNEATYSAYRAAHPAPVDGTVVQSLPSGRYAGFTGGGCRTVVAGAAGTAGAVTVNDASVTCQAPLAVAATVPNTFAVGTPGAMTLTATGGTGPLRWSVVTGVLPAGLTLSSAGVLGGTPTAPGSAAVRVQVADSAAPPATATGDILVRVVRPPSAATTTPPPAVVGRPYSTWLTGTDGTAPYSWSVVGALPPGLTLSPAGLLSGTPTVVDAPTLVLRLTDASTPALTSTVSLVLTVGPAGSVGIGPGG